MLIDSHCHLTFPDLVKDLPDVLARARGAGVKGMLTISTMLKEFESVRALAEAEDDIWCSVGVHPLEVKDEPDTAIADLEKLAAHPKAVAIGETGLDYYYDKDTVDLQQRSFDVHLQAAKNLGLPIIVHTRDADEDTNAMLRSAAAGGNLTGVIHCFTSGRSVAETALDLGFYVSLSGILTFKNAQAIRDIVADIPLESLLVETDSPYLAPVPKRGKRNEPAFVTHTAAYLAELKGVSVAEVYEVTGRNFAKLFSKTGLPQ